MKYFNIQAINAAIYQIRGGSNTNEHITSRAGNGLINWYFREEHGFLKTPEQIQPISGKRPDYIIEKFRKISDAAGGFSFTPHCFMEVKSLVNSNISAILDQVYDTIIFKLDEIGIIDDGNLSCFVIALKGTKIAFYTYHNFSGLLDEYGVLNYKGFIPLSYIIPWEVFREINHTTNYNLYSTYLASMKDFESNSATLSSIGAIALDNLMHPHILDLLNDSHKDHIHSMFMHMAHHSPNIFN
jgi:hypothetical protein